MLAASLRTLPLLAPRDGRTGSVSALALGSDIIANCQCGSTGSVPRREQKGKRTTLATAPEITDPPCTAMHLAKREVALQGPLERSDFLKDEFFCHQKSVRRIVL